MQRLGSNFVGLFFASFLVSLQQPARAGSGVWNGGAGFWAVNNNWTPSTGYPNGAADVATINSGNPTITTPITLNGMNVNNASRVAIQSVPMVSSSHTLYVASGGPFIDVANGAALDITNNAMVWDYSAASPIAAVNLLCQKGYAAGAWTGNGLTSSSAAAAAAMNPPVLTAIGYWDTGLDGPVFQPSWFGQPFDMTSILLRYTCMGDANVDGNVDTTDFNLLASNWGQNNTHWGQGNFDYQTGSSTTNSIDFNLLVGSFRGLCPAPTAPDVAVPEPGTLGLGLLASQSLLRSRYTRRR